MKKIIALFIILLGVLFVAVLPKPTRPKGRIIIFYTNGGDIIPTISVDANAFIREPKNPTRRASTFAGWYKSPTFEENSFFDFSKEKISESLTLYAKWIHKDFTIVYNLEDGKFSDDSYFDVYYKKTFNYEDKIIYLKPSDSNYHPRHDVFKRFTGWREIPQAEYNSLTAEEKEKYPYIEAIEPKGELEEKYPDSVITLYAYYRNFK